MKKAAQIVYSLCYGARKCYCLSPTSMKHGSTSQNRVILGNVIVAQLVNIFSECYATELLINVFARVRN
jgi:hypothetical protein